MRLHRIEVRNFRRHDHVVVDLCDEDGEPRPLTVLIGPNMSGKTTVLDAVHLVYEAIRNQKSPAFRPGFNPSDPTLRPDPNKPIEVKLRWSLHEGEWEAMVKTEAALGSTLAVKEAAQYELHVAWPGTSASFDVLGATPTNAARAFRGRAISAVALQRRVAQEDVLDRIGGVLYLDQERRGTISAAADRLDYGNMVLPDTPMSDVVGWLVRASLQHVKWDEATRGESRWSRVKRIFNKLASPSQLDDVVPYDEGYDLRFRRGDATYFVADSSSGERQILRLAAALAFYRAERSLLLIDEMELNLHPRWQRSLLQFCRTGGDGDNQFIVTTHSDTVLDLVDPASVVTLGVPGGGFK